MAPTPDDSRAMQARVAVTELLTTDPVLGACGIGPRHVLADPAALTPYAEYYFRLVWADPHGSDRIVLQRLSVSTHRTGAPAGSVSLLTETALLDRAITVLAGKLSFPLMRIVLRDRSDDDARGVVSATFDVLSLGRKPL